LRRNPSTKIGPVVAAEYKTIFFPTLYPQTAAYREAASMTNSDPNSIWLYNPNFPLSIVFAILYSIPFTIQFIQTLFIYKSYYFIPVLFGACLEVGGYIVRAVSIKNQSSIVRRLPGSLPSLPSH
jgi:hypothetical protein